jgi:protein-L-isoaspartate O-methyltransferase
MEHTATYSPEDNKLRLYPAHRLSAEEYAAVKAAGFSWAPKQELFVAPMWTPDREDFLLAMCAEIGDEDTSLVERAEAKAERLEDLSGRRAEQSAQAHKAVERITSGIPLGQPILIGHHSERRARKDAERIENGMRKAVSCWEAAAYWKGRAAGAIRLAKYKERPDVRARRIKGLESDRRKCERNQADAQKAINVWENLHDDETAVGRRKKDGTTTTFHERALFLAGHTNTASMGVYSGLSNGTMTPEAAQRATLGNARHTLAVNARWIAHLENRLAYERDLLGESGGLIADQTQIAVGGRVLVGREWLTVLRVTRKDGRILSVTTNRRYVPVVSAENIQQYEAPSQEQAQAVAVANKPGPLCNYPGERFATCTQAEWDAIHKDLKGSRKLEATATAGAHRVRTAIGYRLHLPAPVGRELEPGYCSANRTHTYWPVYITDAKRKDAPPASLLAEPAPAIEPARPVLPAAKPQPEQPKLPFNQEVQFTRATSAEIDAAVSPAALSAKIEELKATLRAGVQVVSAPQLFPTPPDLAARMVEVAGIEDGQRILEPSAGTGNIASAVFAAAPVHIVAVEINPQVLSAFKAGYQSWQNSRIETYCGDFLEQNGNLGKFDRVLMNPPFQNGADIQHIQHAQKFLKPGGRLVALCANGPRQRETLKPLAEQSGGWWEDLPAGAFAEQGTNVNTALLVIEN